MLAGSDVDIATVAVSWHIWHVSSVSVAIWSSASASPARMRVVRPV